MVNGVILLVDAFEGTMPRRSLSRRKHLTLISRSLSASIKIDRPEARPKEVIDECLELMMDLEASDEQLDCPFLFASAKDGTVRNLEDEPKDLSRFSIRS